MGHQLQLLQSMLKIEFKNDEKPESQSDIFVCLCVTPVSILWILCRRSKIVCLLVGWTAVLTAFQVLQIKFPYALPVDHADTY